MEGTYSQILHELKKESYYINILSLTLNPTKPRNLDQVCDYHVEMVIELIGATN